jgi:pyruvate/2-oxoglutarate/acetoin dehydrogenase E1 component
MAEMLAYATLLVDGHNVRLTGQDCGRGTFSHRHAILTDVKTGAEHLVLGGLDAEQGVARVYDSPLSEAAVLGFEFGFSLDYPDALVLWEAQFGDFANGAQVIIDQFITSCEDKWNRLSGLVMLLPHGYEGQGPEHSSARLERFLQSCAEDNIQVAQPTTPAQMFHLLRRQVKRPWRKPLVVMTPKSLLRLPAATSTLDELTTGTYQRILPDPAVPVAGANRVLLCSGKIYFELAAARDKRGDSRHRGGPPRAALSAPGRPRPRRPGRAGPRRRRRLGPGRAGQHGRGQLHRAALGRAPGPAGPGGRPRGQRQPPRPGPTRPTPSSSRGSSRRRSAEPTLVRPAPRWQMSLSVVAPWRSPCLIWLSLRSASRSPRRSSRAGPRTSATPSLKTSR